MNKLRKILHAKRFSYNTEEYPFKEVLDSIFGCDVGLIHNHLGHFNQFERKNDQSTLAHKVFYSNFSGKFSSIYEHFIRNVIKPIINEKFYYQVIPTFRIGLPGNRFVGEFHTDRKYNHQDYEINFNVGIANYMGDASLKVQSNINPGQFELLECPYGSLFSFDHIDLLHGSEPNPYSFTMVSFDFRCALTSLYFDSDKASVNTRTIFNKGAYFSSEAI